ncbi:lysophospholipid acyltransferase family protein [Actinophytocola sp.]|uniref:lysophospholipid acyltransferase family protein n=1 Tax=Actinophytocola sp. TaxID=1872138 RepID=UPI00389A65D7
MPSPAIPTPVRLAGEHLVRHGLRGVWRRGVPPEGPFVWAANHHSWWDPFVAAVVLGRLGRAPCVLMDQDNLRRFRVARLLSAFGTRELRRGLDHLGAGRVLVIFPEGGLRPAGPLGPLSGGAAWYARTAGVPVCAAATRVVLRGHQAPEAYVSLSTVDSSALGQGLGTELDRLDRLVAGTDPRSPLPTFLPVLAGRRSWEERWAR